MMPKKSSVWHPFTQHALQDEMTKIARGDGAYLHTADGRRIIDAISSWWVVTHGYCHPHIVRAIQEQAGTLNQIISAGYTHDAAKEIAERTSEAGTGRSRLRLVLRQRPNQCRRNEHSQTANQCGNSQLPMPAR